MADRGRIGVERGKSICAKEWEVESRDYLANHDMSIAGYGGQWKTVELVTRNY